MKEIRGDIWDYYDQGNWIAITTNGAVRKDGACVMGRGVAKQAAVRFPDLPFEIGSYISQFGNIPHMSMLTRIFTFPVKHNWWEKADLDLIRESAYRLLGKIANMDAYYVDDIYLVRPGCGNGQLDWVDVKPILEKYLDDRFIVVEKEVPSVQAGRAEGGVSSQYSRRRTHLAKDFPSRRPA